MVESIVLKFAIKERQREFSNLITKLEMVCVGNIERSLKKPKKRNLVWSSALT